MNSRDFTRLSVGITYRFDIKKALLSQTGALVALVFAYISEDLPPFGDGEFELISAFTLMLAINFGILIFTISSLGFSAIRLYPSLIVYETSKKQTRIDFSRIIRVEDVDNKELKFYINDLSGNETLGLKIKNYPSYAKSDEMKKFLKYSLGSKFKSKAVSKNDKQKRQKNDFRIKSRSAIQKGSPGKFLP